MASYSAQSHYLPSYEQNEQNEQNEYPSSNAYTNTNETHRVRYTDIDTSGLLERIFHSIAEMGKSMREIYKLRALHPALGEQLLASVRQYIAIVDMEANSVGEDFKNSFETSAEHEEVRKGRVPISISYSSNQMAQYTQPIQPSVVPSTYTLPSVNWKNTVGAPPQNLFGNLNTNTNTTTPAPPAPAPSSNMFGNLNTNTNPNTNTNTTTPVSNAPVPASAPTISTPATFGNTSTPNTFGNMRTKF